MKTPILILFFNREESVLAVVESLSACAPPIIYLASDGGRNPTEHGRVLATREKVLAAIDWQCKVYIKFNDVNLGCKYAVHSAIQWFFENVTEGIVLEDDCVPSNAFLNYAEKMLDSYRDVAEVGTIAGRNEVADFGAEDPIFCSKFFCWGWASWADRIQGVDVEAGYRKKILSDLIDGLGYLEAQHLRGMHSLMLRRQVNSWAYSYDFAFRKKGKLHLIPPVNYVANIGVGVGTHQISAQRQTDIAATESIKFFQVFDGKPKKNSHYLSTYLREKYSYLKIFFFPWIGHIKQMQKFFS